VVLGLAVGVFGVAFGVLAVTSGLSVVQTVAMSILVFTGASQFTAASIIGAGGSPAAALASALLLAARNAFYGISVSGLVPPGTSRLRRLAAAQLTIDESTALALAQPDPGDRFGAFLAGGVSVFVFWNLGTLLGAIGGDAIGDPTALGLDAAFPAGFIALMMPALRHRSGLLAAVSGAGIAAALIPFTRPGIPVLVAAIGAVLAFRVAGPLPDAIESPAYEETHHGVDP
jgi:4-azaleucine resistance transporter AzlC